MVNAQEAWLSCLKYFKENVEATDFDRLFSHVTFDSYDEKERVVQLCVPSDYIASQIDHKYLEHLRVAFLKNFGRIKLNWRLQMVEGNDGKKGASVVVEGNDDTNAPESGINTNVVPLDAHLNTDQTFRTFIEGKSNRFSREIGLKVAEHPQNNQFNPMFIFGPSGCGKTHLMNAIGNHCKKTYPQKRVLYVSAREFQQQFTTANVNGDINSFIAFYQTIDMLLVDDVQEWSSAKKTQDTFIHIFNHLIRNSRRIILASDRPPVELEEMNKRLVTRFACGVLTEMEKPNKQLCVDVLRKKISKDGLDLPEEVVQYVASKCNGSIRELQGIINSLQAFSVVYNCSIDMKLVDRVVCRAVKMDDEPLTVDDILTCVCKHYEVTPNAVKSTSRKRDVVLPRQLAMYLAKKYTKMPAQRIGKLIGSRDHSTVLHAIATVEKRLATEKSFAKEVKEIEKSMQVKK